MKYLVQIKDTIVYSGYVNMTKEEYEELCLKSEDEIINELTNIATFPNKCEEEELELFDEE